MRSPAAHAAGTICSMLTPPMHSCPWSAHDVLSTASTAVPATERISGNLLRALKPALAVRAGHAGSRVGWAIVADPEVARRMRRYIMLASMWSYENQLRGAVLLEHVLATQGGLPVHATGQAAACAGCRWALE